MYSEQNIERMQAAMTAHRRNVVAHGLAMDGLGTETPAQTIERVRQSSGPLYEASKVLAER